ncbi:hypothetical protein MAPG_10773 [Magnaporthiopsis poae ATCC 64411]|uniref:Uncharacterized protein n=1 Tax=Magnaporthiopsis poae (strain ATCC 64411 / 73-15) TaxID=644358 RepID=A0A0C4EDH4_MAGP6|nr:hypothetical protein MAPG_10773 [Magnaporthiopsis poae ATCC 64411]
MEMHLGHPPGYPRTNWPERVALQCYTHRLRRGAWFTHVCLTHLLNWLDGSYVSRELLSQLSKARDLIRDVAGQRGLAPLLLDDWQSQDQMQL